MLQILSALILVLVQGSGDLDLNRQLVWTSLTCQSSQGKSSVAHHQKDVRKNSVQLKVVCLAETNELSPKTNNLETRDGLGTCRTTRAGPLA